MSDLFDRGVAFADWFRESYPRPDGRDDPLGHLMHVVTFLLRQRGADEWEVERVAALFGLAEAKMSMAGFSSAFTQGWDAAVDAAVQEIQGASL